MPPSSLFVAVDMESFAALRIEPQMSTATVYLNLYLFGGHIHVDFEHFPGCCQLKSLLEKFRILPQGCKKITRFHFAFGCWSRGTSAQRTNAKDGHLFQRSAMGAWTRPPLLRKTHKFHTETKEEPHKGCCVH